MVFATGRSGRNHRMAAEVSGPRCGGDRRTPVILGREILPVPRGRALVLALNVKGGGVPLPSPLFLLMGRPSLYATRPAIETGRRFPARRRARYPGARTGGADAHGRFGRCVIALPRFAGINDG